MAERSSGRDQRPAGTRGLETVSPVRLASADDEAYVRLAV